MQWMIFALLLTATLALLLWPLLAGRRDKIARVDHDLAVYRDQLREIDRDQARGLLDQDQVAGARLEVQRRMLAAEESAAPFVGSAAMAVQPRPRWKCAAAVLVLLVAGSAGLYLRLGRPGLPGQPFAGRQNDPAFETQGMIAHIETEMRETPDARGYRLLGDLYTRQSRFGEAAAAYRRALSLGTTDTDIYSLLAEAEVMENDGSVSPQARADFLAALRFDRADPRARFYLGLAESEIGEYRKAVAIWRDLEKDSPPDAPWLAMLQEHIAAFAKQGGFDPASVAAQPPVVPPANEAALPAGHPSIAPGGMPTGALADAIAGAAPEERQQIIRSMVAGLAAKLEAEPGNLDGWMRLARAYKVLGEADKAAAARARAAGLIGAMPAGGERDEAQGRLDGLLN